MLLGASVLCDALAAAPLPHQRFAGGVTTGPSSSQPCGVTLPGARAAHSGSAVDERGAGEGVASAACELSATRRRSSATSRCSCELCCCAACSRRLRGS